MRLLMRLLVIKELWTSNLAHGGFSQCIDYLCVGRHYSSKWLRSSSHVAGYGCC